MEPLHGDALAVVATFLGVRGVSRLMETCQSLRERLKSNTLLWRLLWRSQCFPNDGEHDVDFDLFRAKFALYGPDYARLARVWARLHHVLPRQVLASLRPPTTGGERVEWLPRDVATSFAFFHDGQEPDGPPLFGGFRFYDAASSFVLQPLNPHYRRAIAGSGYMLFVTTDDALFTRLGYVPTERRMTFTQLLEQTADQLESKSLVPDSNGFYSRFIFDDACASDVTTHGVRVQVAVLYVPELSVEEEKHFFAYKVRMTHVDPSRDGTELTLKSRRWVIQEENGDEETVSGPGVVGLHPKMCHGCAPFEYASCTSFSGRRGRMRGSLTFEEAHTGRDVEVEVGEFVCDIDVSQY